MATTASLIAKTVQGDLRKVIYRLTPDATSTSFITGLQTIYGATVMIQSATTANAGYTINESSSGPATVHGEFHMSGVASGDELLVTFEGK